MSNPSIIKNEVISHSLLSMLLYLSCDTDVGNSSPLTDAILSNHDLVRIPRASVTEIDELEACIFTSSSSSSDSSKIPIYSAHTIYTRKEVVFLEEWRAYKNDQESLRTLKEAHCKIEPRSPPKPPILTEREVVTRDIARSIEVLYLEKLIAKQIQQNVSKECVETMELLKSTLTKKGESL